MNHLPSEDVLWPPAARADSVPVMELQVSTASQSGHIAITAVGELDLYTAPRLQQALSAALSEQDVHRVIVDLSGVEFCDSTGMNVLLSGMKRVKERGGTFELAAPRSSVRRILQVTGLDTVFTVHDAVPALDVT
jgi:anti-sigma B factor antagonist